MKGQMGFSAEFSYFEDALKSMRDHFAALVRDVQQFSPKPLAQFAEERQQMLEQLRRLNPDSDDQPLEDIVDGQIAALAHPDWQFHARFSHRLMTEYVTVVLLAHSLCEAAANALLAVNLVSDGKPELFGLVERVDLREKWSTGIKIVEPGYELPKDGALYDTLKKLIRERNSVTHSKISVSIADKEIFKSNFDHAGAFSYLLWLPRFFSVPFDLCTHAFSQLAAGRWFPLLASPHPIERFPLHLKKAKAG